MHKNVCGTHCSGMYVHMYVHIMWTMFDVCTYIRIYVDKNEKALCIYVCMLPTEFMPTLALVSMSLLYTHCYSVLHRKVYTHTVKVITGDITAYTFIQYLRTFIPMYIVPPPFLPPAHYLFV